MPEVFGPDAGQMSENDLEKFINLAASVFNSPLPTELPPEIFKSYGILGPFRFEDIPEAVSEI